jgi:KDO2-lipid IV(A) lauroyltransferase
MPGRRRVALQNLACAMPDLPTAERRAIARASFGHAAAIAMDLLTLPRVTRDVAAHCEAEPGSLEALLEARARGRGVILVAGHFGLFESMGIFLGSRGFPVTFVAKPFDNARLDAAVNRLRTATGNAFIHKGGAKQQAREVLARGGIVAIVIDQHVTFRDRLWIPFFGLPAATTRSMGTLAEETGAPVVPIHSYPAEGGRCRCAFGPVIDAATAGGAEALTHAVIREMERATRRQPEAWLWMHRRWKVRPDESTRHPSYSRSETEEQAAVRARQAAGGGE